MQIADDTDAIAAGPVYRNDCLHAQLVLVCEVKQPGINRAGRPLILVKIARFDFKAQLCDGHQATYELWQAKSLHPSFEIGHALLNRSGPTQELWISRLSAHPIRKLDG